MGPHKVVLLYWNTVPSSYSRKYKKHWLIDWEKKPIHLLSYPILLCYFTLYIYLILSLIDRVQKVNWGFCWLKVKRLLTPLTEPSCQSNLLSHVKEQWGERKEQTPLSPSCKQWRRFRKGVCYFCCHNSTAVGTRGHDDAIFPLGFCMNLHWMYFISLWVINSWLS